MYFLSSAIVQQQQSTINLSIVEAGSLTDSSSTNLTVNLSVTESVSLSDSSSGISNLSVTESGSLSDSYTESMFAYLSISESGSLSYNSVENVLFEYNMFDSVNLSDSNSTNLNGTLSTYESSTFIDSQSNNIQSQVNIFENITSFDIASSTLTNNILYNESGTLIDSYINNYIINLNSTDNGSFIDSSTKTLSAYINVTENGVLSNDSIYTLTNNQSISENGSFIDTGSNSLSYVISYTDTGSLSDNFYWQFLSISNESGNLLDYTTPYVSGASKAKLPLINPYFNQNQSKSNQNIIQGLSTEVIKMMGRVYYYLPRNQQLTQLILGEDVLSSFDVAIPIEMYLVDSMGFDGQKEIYSKFGLQINNSYKLAVSIPRWEQEVMSMFNGQPYLNGTATFNKSNYNRPFEGDLIYDPMTNFLMVIKFVDYDAQFFQMGKNYTYTLSCEAYLYQNEIVDTGVPEIDLFDTTFSQDMLSYTITDEFGNDMLQEDSDYFLQEITGETTVSRDVEVDFQTPSTSINTVITTPFS